MGWICGDGVSEKNKIGQKEVGGVDMRGWRYRKNQNRTEGSGWRGYAGMEVQKNQTKIGQKLSLIHI